MQVCYIAPVDKFISFISHSIGPQARTREYVVIIAMATCNK